MWQSVWVVRIAQDERPEKSSQPQQNAIERKVFVCLFSCGAAVSLLLSGEIFIGNHRSEQLSGPFCHEWHVLCEAKTECDFENACSR